MAPLSAAEFLANYWEKAPLILNRAAPDFYREFLSLDDVDYVLTTLHQRHPQIRLVRGDAPPKIEEYTYPDGRIDPLAVSKLFSQGLTVVLNQMQRRLPRLSDLCRGLEAETGIAFQTNLYLTPPKAGGFKVHYDTHDVFVLQIEGSKDWELFESPVAVPMPGQTHEAPGIAPGAVTHRFTLKAGDLVYIPRGVYHQARASDALSLHITLGAMVRRWSEFLIEAIAELSLRDEALRKSLPIGFGTSSFDISSAKEIFDELMQRAAAGVDYEATSQNFAKEFIRGRDPLLRGQLLEAARRDELSAESIVVLREGTVHTIERAGDRIVLSQLNTSLELPGYVGPSLESVLSGKEMRVAEIAGDLDLPGRITLVRRLIEEGFLRRLTAECQEPVTL